MIEPLNKVAREIRIRLGPVGGKIAEMAVAQGRLNRCHAVAIGNVVGSQFGALTKEAMHREAWWT